MNILEKIQDLCKKRGSNIHQLEIDLGLSKGAVYKWEKHSPSAENLMKVADYFDVSMDYLLDREESETDKEVNEYLDELKNRSEMRMLFKISKNATKEDIEKTVKMLEAWGITDGDNTGC